MYKLFLFFAAIGLTLVTVIGDVLIKKATLASKPLAVWLLLAGAIAYGSTAFGWYPLIKKIEFMDAGVIFSLGSIILISLASVFIFKEPLAVQEIIGLVLAVISIFLMVEFT